MSYVSVVTEEGLVLFGFASLIVGGTVRCWGASLSVWREASVACVGAMGAVGALVSRTTCLLLDLFLFVFFQRCS